MSEVKLFDKLKKVFTGFDGYTHLQRHEDSFSSGIPDVSYGINNINGWIELKYDACFPVTYKTKLRKEQKPWLIRRGMSGGNCFVLHQLGDIFLLIPYERIIEIDELTQDKVIPLCSLVMYGKLTPEIIPFLSRTQTKIQQINGIDHF